MHCPLTRPILILPRISWARSTENYLLIPGIYFVCTKLVQYWKLTPLKKRERACPLSHPMEQRSVVRFFTLKGLSSRDIYTELESMYMDEALCLCTVYKWHRRFMQGRTELFDDPRSAQSLQNNLADALRVMIQEFPFTSCKRLCIRFRLGKATYLRILHDVLRLQKFNLQ
jgi:transposase